MADDPENLTLALLQEIRRDRTEDRQILIGLVDQIRRLDTRIGGIEARMEQLEARMEQLEARMGQMEARTGQMEARTGQMESRLERRFTDLREDLELFFRIEVVGRFADIETRLEQRVELRIDEIKGTP